MAKKRFSRLKDFLIIFIFLGILFYICMFFYHIYKPLPKGVSYESPQYKTNQVKLLADYRYVKQHQTFFKSSILDAILNNIRLAKKWIVIDMFLFDGYDDADVLVAERLTQALIRKKAQNPLIEISVIVDPINTCYGSHPSPYLEKLKQHHILVIESNLSRLRASNPLYSGLWYGIPKVIPKNVFPFFKDRLHPHKKTRMTLYGQLELLNLKANHRKIFLTEKAAIIGSYNFHDLSAKNTNIAVYVQGPIQHEIMKSESAMAALSNVALDYKIPTRSRYERDEIITQFLTEGKIKSHLLHDINASKKGDSIRMGLFYLSDRDVISSLVKASERSVSIQLILDPNIHAFGYKKNGIPNRPAAFELVARSKGAIRIKWYDTHGEQFHPKWIMIQQKKTSLIYIGSANLTKRNLGDYNLEATLKIKTNVNHTFAKQNTELFKQFWTNKTGHYTVNYQVFAESSYKKLLQYYIQEKTGLGTF